VSFAKTGLGFTEAELPLAEGLPSLFANTL
jgi:hypothetical protein